VEATTRVVAGRGPRATTAGEIIEAAGVGRNTFYEHFETSAAAVAESVRRATEELRKGMRFAVSATRTPHERLRALSTTWLAELPRHAVLVAVLSDGASDERSSILGVMEAELHSALELARKSGAASLASDAFRTACVTGALVGALDHVARESRADVRMAGEALADLILCAFR
jgi:AcrR family transcriptional regulator